MASIWRVKSDLRQYAPQKEDMKTDVLIIGGGITGLLTAYMLKQNIPYILIEADKIAGGVTENTTAKITIQHNLIYQQIINQFGIDFASQYAEANTKALNYYDQLIHEKNISCDYVKATSWLYACQSPAALEKEYQAMQRLGIDGRLTGKASIPVDVSAALSIEAQAQFNPLAFLQYISMNLNIFEGTKALSLEDHTVHTTRGKIQADHIVVTTHFPFPNIPGYYFMRMHQERSYVLALKNAGTVKGTWLGVDDKKLSFRSYGDYVLLGGSGHRTGDNLEGKKYVALAAESKKLYPESSIAGRWSAQDCMTHDGIPYIGKFSEKTSQIYTATGFNKWGMTSSMLSALMLTDEISGKKPEYKVFSPQRGNLLPSIKGLVTDGISSTSGILKQNFFVPMKKLDQIKPGQAAIIRHNHQKVGVYKTKSGQPYIVTTRCPHLGCQLTWNPDELSWDCPCHGSRFSYTGKRLDSPAQANLRLKEVEK